MFQVKQQSVVDLKFTEITSHVANTEEEARAIVYLAYANSNATAHYGVISRNGKFIKSIKIGFDGFRKPGSPR